MIYRGVDEVAHAISKCRQQNIVFAGHAIADVYGDHVGWEHDHIRNVVPGIQEIDPLSDSTPILVVEPEIQSAILLREYDTKDKGPLPVWAFEMFLYPTKTAYVLNSAGDILEANGFRMTPQGRQDVVMSLELDPEKVIGTVSSRVKKAARRAGQNHVTTRSINVREYLKLGLSGRVLTESAQYYERLKTMTPAQASAIPYSDRQQYILPRYLRSAYLRDVYTREQLPKLNPFRFFKTTIPMETGEHVLALSVMYADVHTGEWFWLNSDIGRTGLAAEMRKECNLAYAVIWQLIEQACIRNAKKFNLGIATFDYKTEFSSQLEWHAGINYA